MVFFKLKCIGGYNTLEMVVVPHGSFPIESVVDVYAGAKEVMENTQFITCVERDRTRAEPGKVRRQLRSHAGKITVSFLYSIFIYTYSDIFLLNKSVCAGSTSQRKKRGI